ncbi:maltose transport system permease protein MalF [Lachnospiraceae bacterium]|jgi:arabinogalactan oligomer/maltooligosaccharide transport system permease protein|nr:sugar ABC transporter permease [Lachnospiraceae bacterium]GFI16111.1 maltose transport system permease protein MalF [Lachnospiraceae bacterium]GFI68717.1 maltose transport system permease protein MalF [Lachnospiraceae bacterium]
MKGEKRKSRKEFDNPYTLKNALVKGDWATRLSVLIMGAGNVAKGQVIKGILYFFVELAYIYWMINTGIHNLSMLPSLGDTAQEEIWNEAKGIYEYVAGDNSLLILLYGVVTLFVTVLFIIVWRSAVCSAFKTQTLAASGKHLNTFVEDFKSLFNQNLHKLLMLPPMAGITVFTILPLIFMISMAFTNYSKVDDHLVLFDWVGFDNFKKVLSFSDSIGQTFWSVLGWTLIWAIFATFLNYVLGMILAIVINRKETKFKNFWRFCFVLSIAVPQFVSLLIMRTILQPEGAVNVLLRNMGVIETSLPFFTNVTWARVSVIVINLWVGIPYTLLQVTGILKNIPAELYESAKVDGANAVVTFFKITLPYMLFVTTPYMITQFTGNINNFNVIYLLSGGAPIPVGSTAGKTDLLITWLYKLTIEQQYFNLGAVIGILTFVVLAVVALITYRNTGSYKNEEGFQ